MVDSQEKKHLKLFMDFCLTIPNVGLFVFYFVFLLIVPLVLLYLNQGSLIPRYLPLIVPVALLISYVHKNARQLYPIDNQHVDTTGLISKAIINFVAISGIMWISVTKGVENNNIVYGALSGIITFITIFFLSRELIPLGVDAGDKYIKNHTEIKGLDYAWHKYGIGIVIILSLYILDSGLTFLSFKLLGG